MSITNSITKLLNMEDKNLNFNENFLECILKNEVHNLYAVSFIIMFFPLSFKESALGEIIFYIFSWLLWLLSYPYKKVTYDIIFN